MIARGLVEWAIHLLIVDFLIVEGTAFFGAGVN
jgi:hypothetical protein